jgi:hypothetical protein
MMHNRTPDFDELLILAKQDQKRFNTLKHDMTEAWIEQAPLEYQRRLRGIQFQIDMEVRRAKNSMDACIRVSNMMHDSFAELRDRLNEMTQAGPRYRAEDESTPTLRTAQVLPFSN